MPTIDGKVAATKMRPGDYEAFKARCTQEGTTISKKVGDLIFEYMYGEGLTPKQEVFTLDTTRLEEVAAITKRSPQQILDMMLNKYAGY